MELLPHAWADLVRLETPLFELIFRGSAMYFGILVLLRLMPRRTGAEFSPMDLVFVLLITEAATHSLGDYSSVTDGILMVVIFMAWDYATSSLSYHFPQVERLFIAPPIRVVRDGRMLRRNMRAEFLTEGELLASLREQGIDDISEVKSAFIEGEGEITVIAKGQRLSTS